MFFFSVPSRSIDFSRKTKLPRTFSALFVIRKRLCQPWDRKLSLSTEEGTKNVRRTDSLSESSRPVPNFIFFFLPAARRDWFCLSRNSGWNESTHFIWKHLTQKISNKSAKGCKNASHSPPVWVFVWNVSLFTACQNQFTRTEEQSLMSGQRFSTGWMLFYPSNWQRGRDRERDMQTLRNCTEMLATI